MKKCMSGCGGKMMSKGGKVSPVKKMQKGGALKPLGAKIGVGTNIAGMIGMGVKAISDRVKAKKAEKKEKEAALDKKQKGGTIYKPNSIPNPPTPPKKPDYDIKDYINKRSPMSSDKEKGRGLFSKPKGGARGLKLDKKQMGGNVLRRKQPSSLKVTEGKDSVKEFTKNYSPVSGDFDKKYGTGLKNKKANYETIRRDIEKTTGKKSSLKYQKGGIAKQEIVGMPGYNAKTNTMKSGGSAKKTLTKAQAGRVVGNPKKIVDEIKRGPGVPPPTPMDVRKNPPAAFYDKLPDSAKTRPMTFNERETINRSRKPIPSKINPGNKDIFKNAGPPPQPEGYKKGGATKAKKFAALAPPYNKPTAADRIAGAKKRKK